MYDDASEDHGGDAPVSYSENPYKQRSSREEVPDRGYDEGGRSVGAEDDRGGARHREEKGGRHGDSRQRDDDRDRRRHRDDRGDRDGRRDRDDRDDRGDRGDRDRDRRSDREERRDRHRSSRSHRSRSRSRSREPRKRSRQTGFDQGPGGATGFSASSALTANPLNPFPGMPGMPGMPGLAIPPQAMTQQATRHARRVYVGGLPPLANEQSIAKFFSQALAAVGGTSSAGTGDAVVNVYINQEKKFAFVEFRTVEETSNAMALDGIMFEGVSVRVRRPNDYNPALAATLGPSTPNPSLNLQAIGLGMAPGMPGVGGLVPGIAPQAADGPDRIFVGGLPYYLNEEQIRELLSQFGELQAFDLVKDRETGNSKGYGFAVYRDPSVVDVACAGLNGLKMNDKTLTVRRATAVGQAKPDTQAVIEQAQQQIAISMALQQGQLQIKMGSGAAANSATRILVLQEIFDDEELKDDEAYEEIMEDMQDECGKYGTVSKIVIPRPSTTGEQVPGLGKVFVEYSDVEGSVKAQTALHGRKFGGKAVKAEFMEEAKFAAGDFSQA